MPIFDFRCSGCGREFELLVMGEAVPACPVCGSEKVVKLMSRFACSSPRSSGGSSGSSGSGSSCSGCRSSSCASCHS